MKLFCIIITMLAAYTATAQTEATPADYAAMKLKDDSLHHAARYGNKYDSINNAELAKFNAETLRLYGSKTGKLIINEAVLKGFTKAALQRACGEPDNIMSNGRAEAWMYKKLNRMYMIVDGKVFDIWQL